MTTIERLRAVADWFEAHPQAPQDSISYSGAWVHVYVTNIKSFKYIGSFEKVIEEDDEHFYAQIIVGDVTLRFMCPREKVCTARVVGKKQISAQVIPAQPERVIPERTEDIIEWDCSPVLAKLKSEKVDA